ncbi:MAG: hypothetical protein ACERKX_07185 [Anaerolineales bacterium]|jgi:hypothetical protein
MLLNQTKKLVAPPNEDPFWVVFVRSDDGQVVPVVTGGVVDLAINEFDGKIIEMKRIRKPLSEN